MRGMLRYDSRAGARPDADVVVGEAHVQRLAVRFGVDRDRLHAELAAGADDAQRDLAAVGDQNFLEHVTASESSHAVHAASSLAFGIASLLESDHDVSLVPATPCTRSANSLGLVA